MAKTSSLLKIFVMLALVAAGAVLLLPPPASAQEEVASAIRRYKDREASTGYYEEYEVRPRRAKPLVGVPGVEAGIFNYSPTAAKVRNRSHLADSHMGIAFYKEKTCQTCHPEQAKDIHTVRANLTCRQCHGGEPIASIPILQVAHEPDPQARLRVRQVPRGFQRLVCQLHRARTRARVGLQPERVFPPSIMPIGSCWFY